MPRSVALEIQRMSTEERWVWVPFEVDKKFDGYRIDRFLAQRLVGYSRHRVQGILAEARVLKENRPAKANTRVHTGDKIQIAYLRRPETPLAPEASIPILYEDADLVIVNKPGNLLSHPTDKIVGHTVLGVLRHCRPDLPKLHLLHRLDRETSGVIALAKNAPAAKNWMRLMETHRIQKEYIAVIRGALLPREGNIDMPIGREGGEIRVRQWVNVPGAVEALTRYSVVSLNDDFSVVRVSPGTGRLHQIRVHFAAIGHPLLGDPLYTGEGEFYKRMIAGAVPSADRASLGFHRVALHAAALAFAHPITHKNLRIEAPLPADMESLISDKLVTL
jgi:23S rRNA pseudouridine1911/1915/1917 synthase